MKRYRYGMSGAHTTYWALAGCPIPPRFSWHRRRPCAITATKRRYLRRWAARIPGYP